jgi:tripartite ATP-independent transporter DctM subunit
MIVYSLATGGMVSIAALFIAGVVPGILVGLSLMIVAGIISIKNKYGKGERFKFTEGVKRFFIAIPALLLIIIVMGGILTGIFTATEASAIAVVYAFILSVFVYREVKLRDIPEILLRSAVVTSVVFLLIATSMAMSWFLALENVPQNISVFLLEFTNSKVMILLIINLLLLIVGMFMDMTPAVLIFTPIFLPVVKNFGIDALHFGIIMIMNLCIGLCTPPVGTVLFLGCGIAQTTVTKIMRHIVPFFAAMIMVLFICTYAPEISLALPRWFGLIK